MRKLTDSEMLQLERQRNNYLQATLFQTQSNLDYLSMMTGIDLDVGEDDASEQQV